MYFLCKIVNFYIDKRKNLSIIMLCNTVKQSLLIYDDEREQKKGGQLFAESQ